MSEPLHKAEGYWVSSDPAGQMSFDVCGTRIAGHGSVAVRYVDEGTHAGLVWLTLGGRHAGGRLPLLVMNVDAAAELAVLLNAAVNEGRIFEGAALEPIPFLDVTMHECWCPECEDDFVAVLEAEAGQ